MKRISVGTVTLVMLLLVASPALADEQKTSLALKNMTCPSCNYMVKSALMKVDGVKSAKVSFEKKTAYVTFEDSKATIAALIKATTNAGFPSSEIKQKKGSSK